MKSWRARIAVWQVPALSPRRYDLREALFAVSIAVLLGLFMCWITGGE